MERGGVGKREKRGEGQRRSGVRAGPVISTPSFRALHETWLHPPWFSSRPLNGCGCRVTETHLILPGERLLGAGQS